MFSPTDVLYRLALRFYLSGTVPGAITDSLQNRIRSEICRRNFLCGSRGREPSGLGRLQRAAARVGVGSGQPARAWRHARAGDRALGCRQMELARRTRPSSSGCAAALSGRFRCLMFVRRHSPRATFSLMWTPSAILHFGLNLKLQDCAQTLVHRPQQARRHSSDLFR